MSDDYGLPTRVEKCGKCAEHYFGTPFLIEAFSSVGIEHGKSAWQMAEEYFERFHKGKHVDPNARNPEGGA